MGLMSKFNKGNVFKDIDTSNMEYVKLEDMFKKNGADKVYKIQGVYTNPKSKLGESCVAIGKDVQYNLPNYEVETVKEMLADDEVIKAIRAGKVGFKIEPYHNDWGVNKETGEIEKEFYGIDWVDID